MSFESLLADRFGMEQLQIFVMVINTASDFLSFLLTDFKISACRSEELSKRATDKGKQGYYFHG